MKPSTIAFAACLATLAAPAFAQDRLGVPGPIEILGAEHRLAGVDEPEAGYVKQEYIPDGDSLERFETMVLVEFLDGVESPDQLAGPQVQGLEALRASDPVVNYGVLMNEEANEIVLDFVVSGETVGGERIVEWNAYRYGIGEDADGVAGGWLLGISRRAYGEGTTAFLQELSTLRSEGVDALVALPVPLPAE